MKVFFEIKWLTKPVLSVILYITIRERGVSQKTPPPGTLSESQIPESNTLPMPAISTRGRHFSHYYSIAPICQLSTGFFGISRKRTGEHERHNRVLSYPQFIYRRFAPLYPPRKICPNLPACSEFVPHSPPLPADPMAAVPDIAMLKTPS